MTSQRSRNWWQENKEAVSDLVHIIRDTGWKGILKKSLQRKYIIWWLLAILTVAGGILLAIFRDTIVEKITPQREAIVKLPFSWMLPIVLIVLFSFPPFTGRTLALLLVGAVYGLKIGLVAGSVALLIGESLCFWVFKTLFAKKAAKIEQKNLFYASVARMQRKSGIIFLSIVRCSFIPGRVVSATQSISGIPFWKYMAAVVLSMPKMLAAVWLGDLVGREPSPSNDKEHMTVTIIVLVVTNIAGVVALYEVYMRARRYYPELRDQGRLSQQTKESELDVDEGKKTDEQDERSCEGIQQCLLPPPTRSIRVERDEGSDSSENDGEEKGMSRARGVSAFVPIPR
ncbi:hypothetical protein JCM5353_008914 [Sporobolomyces roseus]